MTSDRRIDAIFNWVNSCFWRGDVKSVDKALLKVDLSDIDLVLTYLTATLPARTRLENRHILYESIQDEKLKKGLK